MRSNNCWLGGVVLLIAFPCAVDAATAVESFKNRYFLACTREATSGPEAISMELAAAICSCSANRIAASFPLPELLAIDRDISAHYEKVLPIINRCASEAVNKVLSEQN